MKILVVGGGRLGYYLTKALLESGYEVRLIESDKEACAYAADNLDIPVIHGDGTSPEVIKRGTAEGCDAFIAVTGKDQDNLVACQTAKKLGIEKTFARANNPKNTAVLRDLGVDIAVSSTQIIAGLIEHEVGGAEVKFITNVNQGDAVVSEFSVPQNWRLSGVCLKDLDIPENCVIISVMHNRNMIIPRGNTVISSGDEVMALTIGSAGRKLKKLFEE